MAYSGNRSCGLKTPTGSRYDEDEDDDDDVCIAAPSKLGKSKAKKNIPDPASFYEWFNISVPNIETIDSIKVR